MKTVVAIVVYNRFRNVQEWIKCWQKSVTDNAELVVIHNYRFPEEKRKYEPYCRKHGIAYISRKNIGFDIGAFQDVCRGRLEGFPEYDYLLWCTDDIWPQRPSFIQEFHDAFTDGVSVVCYEISKEVNPHIRTTGFMMERSGVEKIQFNLDPIISKAQCYDFEHRDRVNSFMDQVKRIGAAVQVCDVEQSPLWDTGHNSREAMRRRLRRQIEHNNAFK